MACLTYVDLCLYFSLYGDIAFGIYAIRLMRIASVGIQMESNFKA